MNQKEQVRLQILNSLLPEHMTVDQAAMLMGVSTRHTRRILAAYREEGAAALAHGHRGRRAPNTTPDSIRAEVLRLAACPRNTGVEWFGGIIGVVQQRGAGDEQELPSL